MMKRLGTILAATLTICATLALAACSGPTSGAVDTETQSLTRSTCSSSGANWQSCEIVLPDTRTVTCVAFYWKAISCDWAHASGADKGWD